MSEAACGRGHSASNETSLGGLTAGKERRAMTEEGVDFLICRQLKKVSFFSFFCLLPTFFLSMFDEGLMLFFFFFSEKKQRRRKKKSRKKKKGNSLKQQLKI